MWRCTAHAGLQATSKPTHYVLVHDEIGLSPDELQTLTHDMSYTYARATKAVSLVPPVYYAGLACKRGRCYLRTLLQGFTDRPKSAAAGPYERMTEEEEQSTLR